MYIYYIYNTIEQKGYVGLSTVSFISRWESHIDPENNSLIAKAIQQYGIEAFTFQVIKTATSEKELKELERVKILELNTKHPQGYNEILPDGDLSKRIKEKINDFTLEDIYIIKDQPAVLYKTGIHKKRQSMFRCKEVYLEFAEALELALEKRRKQLMVEELRNQYIIIQRQHTSTDDQLIKAIRNKNYIVEGD